MTLFYFAIRKGKQFQFYDNDYKPVHKPLHGFYSFIHYNEALVLGFLVDYGSQHSGLHTLLKTLRFIANKYRHHIFAHAPNDFLLPQGEPIAGGGILFFNGEVILWHLKSGSFSSNKLHCDDNQPVLLNGLIRQLGLPAERFLNLTKAEIFENDILQQLTSANGQFRPISNDIDQLNMICQQLNLMPVKQTALMIYQ